MEEYVTIKFKDKEMQIPLRVFKELLICIQNDVDDFGQNWEDNPVSRDVIDKTRIELSTFVGDE